MPQPHTAAIPWVVCTASTRMPPSLPAGVMTSLGHLRARSAQPKDSSARTTPRPHATGMPGSCVGARAGLKRMERYSPPSGDAQLCDRRPRPAVCVRALIAMPCGAPARARDMSSSLVEPTLSRTTRSLSACSRVRSICAPNVLGWRVPLFGIVRPGRACMHLVKTLASRTAFTGTMDCSGGYARLRRRSARVKA